MGLREFNGWSLLRDFFYVPASIFTWLILVRFLNSHSVVKVVLIGAISPFIGCIVGLLYAGMGLSWFPWVVKFYYLFAPFGIATSVMLWFSVRNCFGETRGFDVVGKTKIES